MIMVNRKDFRPESRSSSGMSASDRAIIQSSRKKVSNRDGVIKGFIRGESYKTGNDSLSTDGKQLKSYNTVIATRQKNGVVVVNNTKYSQTTTVQQNKLIQSLKDNHVQYEVTGGKDRGYEGEDFSTDDGKTFKTEAEAQAHADTLKKPSFVYKKQVADEKKASKEYSNLAKKEPKTIIEYNVQGNYGSGWEDVTAEDTRTEARQRLKEYNENEPNPHRIIVRRVPNPKYKKLQEISREEKTHAKELEKLGGFESEKDKERIMNKQLPTKHTKIEMGDYKTSPSGFVTDIDGKRVVYVHNIKYEKHGNAKVYINSNGDALHYTDFAK